MALAERGQGRHSLVQCRQILETLPAHQSGTSSLVQMALPDTPELTSTVTSLMGLLTPVGSLDVHVYIHRFCCNVGSSPWRI